MLYSCSFCPTSIKCCIMSYNIEHWLKEKRLHNIQQNAGIFGRHDHLICKTDFFNVFLLLFPFGNKKNDLNTIHLMMIAPHVVFIGPGEKRLLSFSYWCWFMIYACLSFMLFMRMCKFYKLQSFFELWLRRLKRTSRKDSILKFKMNRTHFKWSTPNYLFKFLFTVSQELC